METKAIIFDLDNTLLDRDLTLISFCDKFVDKFSSRLNLTLKEDIIQQIRKSDRNGYRKKDELFEELLEVLPWETKPSKSELNEYWMLEFCNCVVPMNGMMDVLVELKQRGLKLGIITNGSMKMQSQKIKNLNIANYFDSIIISEAVNLKKPDSAIFQLSLDELCVKAEEAIYVGDNPLNDVIGALNAGLNVVWLKGKDEWNLHYDMPKKIVIELKDLVNQVS
jgi:putative hydrolase of the HAD superfamily